MEEEIALEAVTAARKRLGRNVENYRFNGFLMALGKTQTVLSGIGKRQEHGAKNMGFGIDECRASQRIWDRMNAKTEPTGPNGAPSLVQATRSSKGKQGTRKALHEKRSLIASEDLPKKTLEDALKVAAAIKDNYGKEATWEQVATAMHISPNNVDAKYALWSAVAYGVIAKEGNNYRVTETGRKILSPTYDGEDREGIIKAVVTPSILARFYSDYGSSPLPQGDIFKNVLEQRYGIPNKRIDETINLILSNARYAKLLEDLPEGKLKLRSSNVAVGVGSEPEQKPAVPIAGSHEAAFTSSDVTGATDYSKACFIITPIGEDGSVERKHADAMLRHLIAPVLEQLSIIAIRADKIGKPGHITKQTVEHIAFSRLCITDLSFGNQNAHYELGIRHTLKLPSIQIIRKGDKIPFDIQQGRTIIIDTSDPYTIMDRISSARAELLEHVKALLETTGKQEESPITMYLPGLVVKIS